MKPREETPPNPPQKVLTLTGYKTEHSGAGGQGGGHPQPSLQDRRQKWGGERDWEHRSYYDSKDEEVYDDRSSVYKEGRPHSSRTGSVSHYGEQDNSFGNRNMSYQWAMMQQQQTLLQQQQMMAVNPLQYQVRWAVVILTI